MLQRKCLTCLLLLIVIFSDASEAYVGISIGKDVTDSISASEIVSILQSSNIKYVRLFDSDHQMLKALADTGIGVTVSIPNDQLQVIGKSRDKATEWINSNIRPFIPSTNITCIAVGDEVLSTHPELAPILVPTMEHLHSAISATELHFQIKISSPQSMELIREPFPPSGASFNPTLAIILHNFLQFLENTGSFFMLNAHPNIYDLLQPFPSTKQIMDPKTHLYYSNMFDAIIDAAYHSMEGLNYSQIPVLLTESESQNAMIPGHALVHDRSLMWDGLSVIGTPSRPDTPVSIYVNKFFDEVFQHGVVSGRMMYSIGLHSVSRAVGDTFCVANQNADQNALMAGLNWACGAGGANCGAIQPGEPCYDANNLAAIVSYAYNDYFQKAKATGGTCSFNNTAVLSPNDPSHGSCIFTGSSGTGTNPGAGSGGGTNTNSSTGGGGMIPNPPIGPTAFDGSGFSLKPPKLSYLLVSMILLSWCNL